MPDQEGLASGKIPSETVAAAVCLPGSAGSDIMDASSESSEVTRRVSTVCLAERSSDERKSWDSRARHSVQRPFLRTRSAIRTASGKKKPTYRLTDQANNVRFSLEPVAECDPTLVVTDMSPRTDFFVVGALFRGRAFRARALAYLNIHVQKCLLAADPVPRHLCEAPRSPHAPRLP